jgi:uncharacterized coiled-coil protein SlyX
MFESMGPMVHQILNEQERMAQLEKELAENKATVETLKHELAEKESKILSLKEDLKAVLIAFAVYIASMLCIASTLNHK